MLLTKADIALINGYKHHQEDARIWPGGKVSFAFARDFPNDKRSTVKESLGELQNDLRGCIKFIESNQGPFIDVHAQNKGCFAMIGFTGQRGQYLNLENPWCMNSKGTIKHEFIHALGFMHTHMRSDRENYISINWPNIKSDQCFNFEICNGCIKDGDYETRSVMHYSSDTFGCRQGMNTMIQKNGQLIDYNHNTTPNDLEMIRRLYRCG